MCIAWNGWHDNWHVRHSFDPQPSMPWQILTMHLIHLAVTIFLSMPYAATLCAGKTAVSSRRSLLPQGILQCWDWMEIKTRHAAELGPGTASRSIVTWWQSCCRVASFITSQAQSMSLIALLGSQPRNIPLALFASEIFSFLKTCGNLTKAAVQGSGPVR